jgi:small subunit ribosomal protein S9
VEDVKMVKAKVIVATGKRKTAIAKAVVRPGRGRVYVRQRPVELVEPMLARWKMMEPLIVAGDTIRDVVDITVDVRGGGFMGQAEATRTAIAQGLVEWSDDEDLKEKFENYDRTMLAGDARKTEPKKFGGPGARRRRQKSYR